MQLLEDIKTKIKVNNGFKETEVGVIPQDWEVVRLKNLIADSPTYGINAPAVEFSESLPQYLRITDISDSGEYIHSGKASVNNPDWKRYILKEGEIVFARTGASVGKSYHYNPKDGILVYAGFLIKITPDTTVIDSRYLAAFLQTKVYWNWVAVMSMRSGQPGINGIEYGSLFIPIPPTLAEQKAIAKSLTDVDALVSNLDKLITKKEAIKQGAMQQLLISPKQGGNRLSGFEGEWEEKNFIHVVSKYIDYRGRTPKKLNMDWGGGEIPALSANNVQMGRIDFNKECYYGSEALYGRWMEQGSCKKGDVLLTMEAPLGNVAQIPDNRKYILSQRVVLIKTNNLVDDNFLYHYMISDAFQNELQLNATGSTAQGIQRKRLDKIKISFPKNIREQQSIAAILSDMDAEIKNLQKKKAKYQSIKQGMMQELLTGKTRLV
ncbi:restriction endonuclease subunit S [Rufibacter hautae]|uniref:Type I restriction modification DNA specificity domain-containing protein n=1 Tax=Rufibacter hautae TaxID=2595005 RepID=A0A5B6T9X1_9BACT|nr:restriction endonuclease subunit S [Rufibacter hautae]KAA3436735.1 hypothetical protein FOA19_20365 [Rufibacter hautae]